MARKSALPPSTPVHDHHGLCLALGGDSDSFTGDLLRLIAKADPVNRTRLMLAFPGEVVAWEHWVAKAPAITAGEIVSLAEAAEALVLNGHRRENQLSHHESPAESDICPGGLPHQKGSAPAYCDDCQQ